MCKNEQNKKSHSKCEETHLTSVKWEADGVTVPSHF